MDLMQNTHRIIIHAEPSLVQGRSQLNTFAARCSCGWIDKANDEAKVQRLADAHLSQNR